MPIRAICFDAFGTIVEIGDKRRPFRELLDDHRGGGRSIDVLTRPLGLREVVKELAIAIGEARLIELEKDLSEECASVHLRPGMDLAWAAARRADLRIGVCSNLAQPYAEPLLACLPGIPDALILSFEVGTLKPEAAIYHILCERLGCSADEILFVGDSPRNDELGPRAIGMHAISVSRFERALESQADDIAPPVQFVLDRLRECACS